MKPCLPDDLPLKTLDWGKYVKFVGQANGELARFDGILQAIINPAVLLSPLTTNEAVLSSKIEGTQATLEEVLKFEATPDPKNKKLEDIHEILNYRKAISFAMNWLKDRPITLNMIKQAHSILMDSVRGQHKTPGSFRITQNWIGKPGTPVEKAIFIPPDPLILKSCLENFEHYIVYEETDPLVQMAIIHAQFEIIHPFLDGNGRLGRMLIPLFLYQKKLISSPMFYISEYLDEHKDEYAYRLNRITEAKNWDEWILFFLNAIIIQSKNNAKKAKSILDLYETKKQKISDLTHSQFAIKIVDTLFKVPLFTATEFVKMSGIPAASAKRYLNLLEKNEILIVLEKGHGRRSTVYSFKKLFDIVK